VASRHQEAVANAERWREEDSSVSRHPPPVGAGFQRRMACVFALYKKNEVQSGVPTRS
jgi:hypothetical protein